MGMVKNRWPTTMPVKSTAAQPASKPPRKNSAAHQTAPTIVPRTSHIGSMSKYSMPEGRLCGPEPSADSLQELP